MPNIFSAIIFVLFIPVAVFAESWIQIDLAGWDKKAFFNGVGWIHRVTLVLCLLIGPWQFIPALYRKNPMLHFALGNVYVMLSLLLAAISTMVFAFGQNQMTEGAVLFLAGCIWWWSTRKGIYYISEKKWLLHLEWMSYSYLSVLCISAFSVLKKPLVPIVLFLLSYIFVWVLKQRKITQKILAAFFKS